MNLKDEIQWASDHALYHERSAFRHDEPVSAVISVEVLKERLESIANSESQDFWEVGYRTAFKDLLKELEDL